MSESRSVTDLLSNIVGLHDRKKVPVAPHLVVGALPRENCSLKETHYWMASNSRPLGEALSLEGIGPHTVLHNAPGRGNGTGARGPRNGERS